MKCSAAVSVLSEACEFQTRGDDERNTAVWCVRITKWMLTVCRFEAGDRRGSGDH